MSIRESSPIFKKDLVVARPKAPTNTLNHREQLPDNASLYL